MAASWARDRSTSVRGIYVIAVAHELFRPMIEVNPSVPGQTPAGVMQVPCFDDAGDRRFHVTRPCASNVSGQFASIPGQTTCHCH